jgi:hypothetical protein
MIYWSREHYGFGLKPLINVTHTMFYKASPSVTVIAAKQIWASHYYDGSLGITVLADANPGTYFVYLNRSRIDLLRSAGFKRWLVASEEVRTRSHPQGSSRTQASSGS